MKAGVLTYHRSHNYGAYLQAVSLCTRLREMGLDAELIDFTMEKGNAMYAYTPGRDPFRNRYRKRMWAMFEENVRQAPLSGEHLCADDCAAFAGFVRGRYDLIVAGSDEIWKTDGVRGFPTPYWLLGEMGCKKAAYAVSARADFAALTAPEQATLRAALADFAFLGVRDDYTLGQVSAYTGAPVHLCCDPTFLVHWGDRERGRALLQQTCGVGPEQKCVGLMGADPALLRALKKTLPRKTAYVSFFEFCHGAKNPVLTPAQWADAIAGLDFLCTRYFHGACLSLQNDVPFFALDARETGTARSKLYDILARTGQLERFTLRGDAGALGRAVAAAQAAFAAPRPDFSALRAAEQARFAPFAAYIAALREKA